MLKQAVIVLLLFIGSHATASNCMRDTTDTIRVVTIKVTLTPKDSSTKLANRKNVPEKPSNINNIKRRSTKRTKPTLPVQRIPEEKIRPKSGPDNKASNISEDSTGNFVSETESNRAQAEFKTDRRKDFYFFTGLVLLIAGIIITLFFRSGLSLVAGIILIVSGYYTLLYSMLFMS